MRLIEDPAGSKKFRRERLNEKENPRDKKAIAEGGTEGIYDKHKPTNKKAQTKKRRTERKRLSKQSGRIL